MQLEQQTADFQRGMEAAAAACDLRALSYRERMADFAARGFGAASETARMKAETAESIARTIREMAKDAAHV